jgi:hypothetical protein
MVGAYIGLALPVLATVFVSPWKAIAIIAFATVYQLIENYYFTPRVVWGFKSGKSSMIVNTCRSETRTGVRRGTCPPGTHTFDIWLRP